MVGTKQRAIFWSMIVVGVGFFVAIYFLPRENRADLVLSTPGVEAITPERNDEVLQQQAVSIDLEAGWVPISFAISPDARCSQSVEVVDFVRLTDGLNIWTYQPDEGRPIAALAPDTNCVRVTIENIQRRGETHVAEWTFTVN